MKFNTSRDCRNPAQTNVTAGWQSIPSDCSSSQPCVLYVLTATLPGINTWYLIICYNTYHIMLPQLQQRVGYRVEYAGVHRNIEFWYIASDAFCSPSPGIAVCFDLVVLSYACILNWYSYKTRINTHQIWPRLPKPELKQKRQLGGSLPSDYS